uniref:Uncharacterized protein n=1 Tax=Branchiostoma floridae TaxID=7739 RepID=C3YY49_BRAFL|eukprot:XP_002598996.1 hypothetical protein BRAFLDRAFT_79930 [Branchiostoma floridae]
MSKTSPVPSCRPVLLLARAPACPIPTNSSMGKDWSPEYPPLLGRELLAAEEASESTEMDGSFISELQLNWTMPYYTYQRPPQLHLSKNRICCTPSPCDSDILAGRVYQLLLQRKDYIIGLLQKSYSTCT